MRDELILIGLYITTFGLGYVLGRLRAIKCAPISENRPRSFLRDATAEPNTSATAIDIDNRKYVTPINTSGLTLSTPENGIGKTSEMSDNIQTSVSKLAQLKGE